MAGPQQPGHCCRDLFGGRSSLHLLGGGGQMVMLKQASVFSRGSCFVQNG